MRIRTIAAGIVAASGIVVVAAVASAPVAASAPAASLTAYVVNAHVLTSSSHVHKGEVLVLRQQRYTVASVHGSAFSLTGAGLAGARPRTLVTFSVG